jgi:hypothetical protein
MTYRSFQTPLLLLLFNRPQHTAALVEVLRQLRPTQIFVHSDGPRAHVAGEKKKVEAVRAALGGIDWPCEVHTLFRDENAGLRNGVSGALDWFFGQVQQGIVLEDDCAPDLSFFPFCETLLHRYADDPQVMHIGGSNVAESLSLHDRDSYFFSRFAFVWGWASWRRAWEKMSLTLDGLDEFERQSSLTQLSSDCMAQVYLYDKFRATAKGENNSWAYAWFYSILRADGRCVVPKVNLVQNTGIGDAGATHTKGADKKASIRAHSIAFPLQHPSVTEPAPARDRQIFYFAQKSRFRLILWFLLKKIGLR